MAFYGRFLARFVGIAALTWQAMILIPIAPTQARESFTSVPSSQFVATFFDDLCKIIFLNSGTVAPNPVNGDVMNDRRLAVRDVLARSVDAKAISRFILGRYGNDHLQPKATATSMASPSVVQPEDGFLDFAAASVMRLTPHAKVGTDQGAQPVLSILTMTVQPDQTRLVRSELVLADGRTLPLTWQVSDQPAGLRIEDVTCLGISLRLMLRSAVAEAAAEHPDQAHDLSQLLGTNHAFAQFAPGDGSPQ